MSSEIIIGIAGLVGVFVAWYALSGSRPAPHPRRTRPSSSEPDRDLYHEVLNDDKYKVKGQWER